MVCIPVQSSVLINAFGYLSLASSALRAQCVASGARDCTCARCGAARKLRGALCCTLESLATAWADRTSFRTLPAEHHAYIAWAITTALVLLTPDEKLSLAQCTHTSTPTFTRVSFIIINSNPLHTQYRMYHFWQL